MEIPTVYEPDPLRRKKIQLVSFRKLESWSAYNGLAYSCISDRDILAGFCVQQETDIFRHFDKDERGELSLLEYHAYRIALLVSRIEKGFGIRPILMDSIDPWIYADEVLPDRPRLCSCVADGNHRLRALQYLGYTHYPALFTCQIAMPSLYFWSGVHKENRPIRTRFWWRNLCFEDPASNLEDSPRCRQIPGRQPPAHLPRRT